MSLLSIFFILYAAILGAEMASGLQIAAGEVLQGVGLLVAAPVVSLGLAMATARILKGPLGCTPLRARDVGLGTGIILGGIGVLGLGLRLGASHRWLGWGAGIGAFLGFLLVAYEGLHAHRQRKVGLQVLGQLDKGRRSAFGRDFGAAEKVYCEALLEAELNLGSRDTRTLLAVRYLAEMYQEAGQSRRASRLWERCNSSFAELPDPSISEYGLCLFGKARFHDAQKDVPGARECAERAKSVLELDVAANPHLYVDVLQLLADLYAQEKEFDRAAAAAEEALTVLKRAGLGLHRTRLLVNLVDYHVRFDRPDEAEALVNRAFTERKEAGLAEDEAVAHLLYSRAGIAAKRGQDALPYKMEALKVLRRAGGPDHPLTRELLDGCLPLIAGEDAPKGYRELFLAIRDGMTSKVVRLLERNAALVKVTDGSGWTPLQWAAYFGSQNTVDELVIRGADVTVGREDMTPLHLAARWGHTKVAVDLVRKGADVHALDGSGSTPLHCAAASSANRVVDALVADGARVDVVNHAGLTPLHCAAMGGRSRLIVDLIENGAKPDAKIPSTGETALHLAVRMGHRGATECLLLSGAGRNARDRRGRTALALARAQGRDDLITALKGHKDGE